jgi:GT2 family glycosyltransferase
VEIKCREIGIVLVNYKTISETIDYFWRELVKIKTPFRLVVVNNAADEEGSRELAEALNAQLVDSQFCDIDSTYDSYVIGVKENLGYAKGNNLGADFLCHNFSIDYLLFTNNDLKIVQYDILDVLIQKLDAYPDIGMIGPRILGLDGVDQSPHRYLPLWSHSIIPLFFYPVLAFFIHMGYFREVIRNACEGYCYRVMGCFCMSPVRIFREVGGFDPNTFLYAEELIFAERLKFYGYRMYYTDVVEVVHDHGTTTRKFIPHKSSIYMERSLRYYYKVYRNANSWSLIFLYFSQLINRKFYARFRRVFKVMGQIFF